jgi:hypothetical protein
MFNHQKQINLEEENNRNMKGKFKLLGHIGLALFLVSALVLAVMPVAQAATAVTNVWVQFTQSTYNKTNTASDFTFHFTPTTAMERGVDTITVWFPDGATAMGPDNFSLSGASSSATYYVVDRDGEVTTYSATDCVANAVLSTTGYRVTVVTPVDLDAGTPCSFRIEAAAGITCADSTSHTPYYMKLYTSKDTTPVLSDAVDIDATGPDSVSLSLSPTTAGSAGQYTFTIDLSSVTALTAGTDTLTFIFPYQTTIPSSIAADKVSFSTDGGSSWSTGTTDATVNQKARKVTVTTPVTMDADGNNQVRFSTGAAILNPQTVPNSNFTDCFAYTSDDELQVAESSGYTVTAGTETKLGFNNDAYPSSAYSDEATMINMYSNTLYIECQDTYGNKKDPDTEPTVSLSSSAGTGIFYNTSYAQISSSATTSGGLSVFYRDSVAGTVTLTASATGYTSGTWTMTIAPGVGLYDSNNNLIKTYAPSATNTDIKEASGYHGGDYVNDAISASLQGDTVKLGDGIYEVDTVISVSAKITLTSENGASSTTLKPTTDAVDAVKITTDGTATYPITISGLTFTRLRATVEFDQGVYNNGYDYVTVQNCTFDYVIPGDCADHEYGSVVGFVLHPQEDANAGTITSGTISNNTFTNCCLFAGYSGGESGVITIMTKASAASGTSITGITVSNNTLTDCNGLGITANGYTGVGSNSYVTATISDNTLTNQVQGLSVQRKTTSVKILRNTVTGSYTAGLYVESIASSDHDSLVVKNNTFTDCAGADKLYYSSMSAVIVMEADGGAGANTVQYNAIYDNDASYSIYVSSNIGAQSCQYNWFGYASGPYYSALTGATVTKSNTDGEGKKVTDYVTYYPWLHKSLTDVVADNVSYQACNIKLVSGWNTLSTPVKLISTADSIDELIPSGMTIGYYYDGGWQQITTGYVLNPCDAVYVKMSAATYVQFKFDAGAFSNPSKDLDVGWNLISLASLDSSKTVANTMACVDLTAGNLPGWSQVVSPSMNAGQTDIYGATETAWAESAGEAAGQTMQPGLGYWTYMQNAATLAGFEITPIVPDLD